MHWRRRIVRGLLIFVGVLAVLLLIGGLWVYFFGNQALTNYVQSQGFRDMLARQVRQSLKVEGDFAPIKRDGWTAGTDWFKSKGLPGQVLTELNAEGVSGKFNPDGVFQGLWEFDYLEIEKATVGLQSPNSALQQPIKKAPKPWYAAFLPSRFYPKVIRAKEVTVEWEFRNEPASIQPMELEVVPVGKDWNFVGHGGDLHMALTPAMAVDKLEILLSRDWFTIEKLVLVGPIGETTENAAASDAKTKTSPSQGRIEIDGKIGLKEDKSIQAGILIEEVPIREALPEKLRPFISATANGKLEWHSVGDVKGSDSARGNLQLQNPILRDLPFLKALAQYREDPTLQVIQFTEAGLSFTWKDHVFRTRNLRLRAPELLALDVEASYNFETDNLKADAQLWDVELDRWVTGVSGTAKGKFHWNGDPRDPQHAEASGSLSADGAKLESVPFLDRLAGRYDIHLPGDIVLDVAELAYQWDHEVMDVQEFVIRSKDTIWLEGKAKVDLQKDVDGYVTLKELPLPKWLPKKYQRYIRGGNLQGTMKWDGPYDKLQEAKAKGGVKLSPVTLQNLELLDFLARFLKDDSFRVSKLDTSSLRYDLNDGAVTISHIDLEMPDKMAVNGWFMVSKGGALAGTIQLGMPERLLGWLPNNGADVFVTKRGGYRWVDIHLGGTLKHPKQDLTERILDDLFTHPCYLIWMLIRAISWWLGDVLGTYPPGD